MPKTKYYAIKLGDRNFIVDQWSDCESKVKGVSGAQYKSFKLKKDAEAWLGIKPTAKLDREAALRESLAILTGEEPLEEHLEEPANLNSVDEFNESIKSNIPLDSIPQGAVIQAYVDGSFQPSVSEYAGWGVVLIYEDQIIETLSGKTNGPAISRNIDGELRASLEAMKWANTHQRRLEIFHDYEGIAKWVLGQWKAKSEIAKMYVQASRNWVHLVDFTKVAAHSGDKWNDLADELAKEGLKV